VNITDLRGEVEGYPTDAFDPIAEKVAERASVRASTPMFQP
jgi:hypothetical protein